VKKKSAKCSITGCSRKSYARTWCLIHYRRWYKHRDPQYRIPRLRHESVHVVRFTPKMWKRWLRERHPHAPQLRSGIAAMRRMLEMRGGFR
jgi:hypothetical protein